MIAAQHAPDLEENIRNHLTLYSGPIKDNTNVRESGKLSTKAQGKNAKHCSSKEQETNDEDDAGEEEEEYDRTYQNGLSSKGTQPTVGGQEDEEENGDQEEEEQESGNGFDQFYKSTMGRGGHEKTLGVVQKNNFFQTETEVTGKELANYSSKLNSQARAQGKALVSEESCKKMAEVENKKVNDFESKKGNELDDPRKIEAALRDPRANKELIAREANGIINVLVKYLETETPKIQESVFKLLKKLFESPVLDLSNWVSQESIHKLLNLYHVTWQANIQIDEVFETMIDRVNKLLYMKALVDRLAIEKSPILQMLIRLASQLIKAGKETEIKPCLDGLIEVFKKAIKDQSPDVRKSVVFCLVDLYFLFYNKMEPYLQMFDPTQQKLVSIYIKRRQDHQKNQV